MAEASNILSATRVGPARGVTAQPAQRPGIAAVAVPGQEGRAGQDGAAAAVQIFSITASASFTAPHGLPIPPRVWIVDPAGSLVDTDLFYAPGQVTAMFAQPFTGTLYCG